MLLSPLIRIPAHNAEPAADRPLADRMRPATLGEFAGQTHLLEEGKPLRRAIEQGRAGTQLRHCVFDVVAQLIEVHVREDRLAVGEKGRVPVRPGSS